MKCHQCDKPAVFHITELETGEVRELHFCEDHARTYLNQSEAAAGEAAGSGPSGGPLAITQTADELAAIDQKACPMCGITFFEFRNQGRLGCPHDYVHFEKELEPLIANIHGSTRHAGRRPDRAVAAEAAEAAGTEPALPAGTQELTRVIGLRRDMKEAIAREDYEQAREARDEIRGIEEKWLGTSGA
jgi:protein arginine kinase activator